MTDTDIRSQLAGLRTDLNAMLGGLNQMLGLLEMHSDALQQILEAATAELPESDLGQKLILLVTLRHPVSRAGQDPPPARPDRRRHESGAPGRLVPRQAPGSNLQIEAGDDYTCCYFRSATPSDQQYQKLDRIAEAMEAQTAAFVGLDRRLTALPREIADAIAQVA
jgi:hypothetical protein